MTKWKCPVEGCKFEQDIPNNLDMPVASLYADRIIRHFHTHTLEEIFRVYLGAAK